MSPTPDVPEASTEAQRLRQLGIDLWQQSGPKAALEYFERALKLEPSDSLALLATGNALQELRRCADAISVYDQALQLEPDLVSAWVNRSNALRALGRSDEALRDEQPALRYRPDFPYAWNSHGNLLREAGRLEEARASFDRALLSKADFDAAYCNRGKLLLDLQRPREALADFESVLGRNPQDAEALFGRASALARLGERLQQAYADFAQAAELGIDLPEVLAGQAGVLALLNRFEEAEVCFRKVVALAPDWEDARGSWVHLRCQLCDWTDIEAEEAELCRRIGCHQPVAYPLSLFAVTDAPDLITTCTQVMMRHRYRALQANSAPRAQPIVSAAVEKRIRLAYVSADFCEHPVAELLAGVLDRHDRERFELIGVSLQSAPGSPMRARIQGACHRFIEAEQLSDEQIALRLRELGVDIALDLMGFTQGMRLGIFAHRAAPVQVNYLGYAGTLGAPYMDYIVADEVVIPQGQEAHYSEQVVRLPHCYLPNDDRREIGEIPSRSMVGLPEGALVLCAFTNTYKINPPMYEVWMRLLRELPESVLWLRAVGEPARGNLLREAQRRGVEAERLIFAEHVSSMSEHLARQALADLYLDTVPYNAHSTACDALWAGVPVLSCAGRSFASRVAASALQAVGLAELVTESLQQYERVALELGRERPRLAALRARLAAHRLSAPLFDTRSYTRALESALHHMHQRARLGLPPAAFNIAADNSGVTGVRVALSGRSS